MTVTQMTDQKSSFTHYSATKKLQGLAKDPINLAQKDVLTPERLTHFVGEACGYKLLYGTEHVTDEVMKALEELAQECHALKKMQEMQAGVIRNYIENFPSENRPALHTATRDFFEDPQTAPQAKEATQVARQEIEKLRVFINKLEIEKNFTDLVTIGIGGSDLGPRAHYFALEKFLQPGRRVHFISNVDPDDAAAVLKPLDLSHTLVVVVSKSGTTLETATNEAFAREKFKGAGLNPKEHFVSVSTPKSPMDNKNNYLECFYVWDWIGGRFCSTTMCAGVMLSFAFGVDLFWEFLKGAHAMDRVALKSDIKQNLPLLAALIGIWNRNFLKHRDLAIIPYSQALHRYPAHLQQLDMESNGKYIDQKAKFVDFETGPAIWGEPGTNGQHSFFQLLHQGTTPIPVFMIGFKKSQYQDDINFEGTSSQEKLLANLFAQSLALATGQSSDNPNKFFPGNRSTHILLGEQLTPFALGALLSFYENKVAFQGFIWGINSFDQEGVQLGKLLATKLIQQFALKNGKEGNASPYPLGNAYLKQLDHFNSP
jgi:glucose-6-phosphate isomerase